MTTDITRRRLLGGCATAGLLALPGCSGLTPFVGRQIEASETIDPEDAETMAVDVENGDVTIAGDDRDDVGLDIVKQSSSISTDLEDLILETERAADALELRSVWEGSDGWFTSRPSMDLDAAVPQALSVDRISTSVGAVTVRDVGGEMTLTTSTGRVDVANVDGSVFAETTTGRVKITGVSDTVTADTTTGRIEIRDGGLIGDLSATTGRIEADVPAIDGDTTLSTTTGRITAAVSSDLDAELVAETDTGRIDVSDLDMDDATVGDDRATGTLGEGGPTLRIETSTGRITLEQLD